SGADHRILAVAGSFHGLPDLEHAFKPAVHGGNALELGQRESVEGCRTRDLGLRRTESLTASSPPTGRSSAVFSDPRIASAFALKRATRSKGAAVLSRAFCDPRLLNLNAAR